MTGASGTTDMPRPANTLIGAPIVRREDPRFLRGEGTFVGDLSREETLHAVILRSSVAHGRITDINTASALAAPGVHSVLTAAEIGEPIPHIPLRQEMQAAYQAFQQPIIAHGKVRYVGEPVAVVVADSVALAEDARELIDVAIEPLPAVTGRQQSLEGATLLFEDARTNSPATISGIKGDAEAAFANAPYTRRERFSVQRHSAIPMEPRGLLAAWDNNTGTLTVHGAAKTTHHNKRILAQLMGLAAESVLLIENDVGGGFGVRGEFYPEDFLIPFAARHLDRPVMWQEDRQEHMVATNHSREAECEVEIACDTAGRILALRAEGCVNTGAYIRTNAGTPPRNISQVMSGPYRIEHIQIEVRLLVSNKTPSGTYRAPGRFEADFFRERLFDLVADDLGLDRVEFRRRNLVREEDMPWPLATVMPLNLSGECDSGDYQQTLDRCLAEFDWSAKLDQRGEDADGRYHGIAVGCYIEGTGSGKEWARLELEDDGGVTVALGSSSVGQGVETVFAQIAGDALGLPLERIRRVRHGSTDLLSDGGGSFASRSVVMAGSALMKAAEILKTAIREAAAARLGCTDAEVELIDAAAAGPNGEEIEIGVLAGDIDPVESSYANPNRAYSYGAHAVHVAVDPDTGGVSVLDYVAVEDVGRIINPLTLHGQCTGAIVQGLGGALMEHLAYDEAGQLLSGTLADYALPIASDFPVIRVVALEEKPAPGNPLGAKGAGEGGIIPTGGVIANAVADALSPLGVAPNSLPLSPSRVWAMIADARK